MESARINELTNMQRNCLRLVARPMSSKEIARELKLSSQTVDTHVKLAMGILGVNSRHEAARMLVEFERPGSTQYLVTQSPWLAEPGEQRLSGVSSAGDAVQLVADGQEKLRERRAPFASLDQKRWRLPLPIDGRRGNPLTPAERLVWILVIMIATIVSLAMLASTAETIGRIVSAIATDA